MLDVHNGAGTSTRPYTVRHDFPTHEVRLMLGRPGRWWVGFHAFFRPATNDTAGAERAIYARHDLIEQWQLKTSGSEL